MYQDNGTPVIENELIEDDKQLAQAEYNNRKGLYLGVLVLLGLFNNIGYVLVNSSSQTLAEQFHQEDFMSSFTFCLTSMSIATSFVNSKFLLKTRHVTKIRITLILLTLGYLLVGLSNIIDTFAAFIICLFGSVILGISQALGEQTILGFLKGFAPDLIGGWGCGTGMAGVVGSGINFGLRYINVPGYIIFLGMIPTSFIYLFGFMWLKAQKVHQIEVVEVRSRSGSIQGVNPAEQASPLESGDLAQPADEQEANINQVLTRANLKRVWPLVGFMAANLCAVYFLEYTIITGFADKATQKMSKDPKSNGIEKNSFIVLNLCYQLGVLISRSSIVILKIRKILVITLLQFINFVVWAWVGYSKPFGLAPMFTLMVWVGLMGGCSYVNVLYGVLESKKIEKKDKEMAINIIGVCNNLGVLVAAFTALILETTIYKDV